MGLGKWRPILERHTLGPGQNKVSIGIWVGPDCSSWRISLENGVTLDYGERALEAKLLGIFITM